MPRMEMVRFHLGDQVHLKPLPFETHIYLTAKEMHIIQYPFNTRNVIKIYLELYEYVRLDSCVHSGPFYSSLHSKSLFLVN